MGSWGTGPFDNDTAADWCSEFDAADPSGRAAAVVEALAAAADEKDYLESPVGEVAVAAAAVVAFQIAGTIKFDSPYAPNAPAEGFRLDITPDLIKLAIRALDRTTGDGSEWSLLWADADDDSILGTVDRIRMILTETTIE